MATVAIARHRPRGRLAIIGLGPGARDLLTPRAVSRAAPGQRGRRARPVRRPDPRPAASGHPRSSNRASARKRHARTTRSSAGAGRPRRRADRLGRRRRLRDGQPGARRSPATTSTCRGAGHHRRAGRRRRCSAPRSATTTSTSACPTCTRRGTRSGPACRPPPRPTWSSRSTTRAAAPAIGSCPRRSAILAKHRPSSTPVGIVRNASRPDERVAIDHPGRLRPDDRSTCSAW